MIVPEISNAFSFWLGIKIEGVTLVSFWLFLGPCYINQRICCGISKMKNRISSRKNLKIANDVEFILLIRHEANLSTLFSPIFKWYLTQRHFLT